MEVVQTSGEVFLQWFQDVYSGDDGRSPLTPGGGGEDRPLRFFSGEVRRRTTKIWRMRGRWNSNIMFGVWLRWWLRWLEVVVQIVIKPHHLSNSTKNQLYNILMANRNCASNIYERLSKKTKWKNHLRSCNNLYFSCLNNHVINLYLVYPCIVIIYYWWH